VTGGVVGSLTSASSLPTAGISSFFERGRFVLLGDEVDELESLDFFEAAGEP
jgi:hypothetical protein